jgi:hypothetical protein
VIPLPADAILHLKPADIDWANSRVFRNRFLLKPGATRLPEGIDADLLIIASEESLVVKISRDNFIARFKHLLVASSVASPPGDAIGELPNRNAPEGRKPHGPKGSSYDKPDAKIIESMRPLVQDRGMMPTRAVKTLLKNGVKLEGTLKEENKIKRIVGKYKQIYGV